MRADVAVIILTYNEEANIAQALASVCGWAREVHVVDSFSADATVQVSSRFDCQVHQHHFENYAKQRNWALSTLPIQSEWILFLDADEWVSEDLKQEIVDVLASNPEVDGFLIKWRFIWRGVWIRRGYYPNWLLRLFRAGRGRCEDRAVNEHMIVPGAVGRLKNDFIHEDRKPLSAWIEKHSRYARREAAEIFTAPSGGDLPMRLFGRKAERTRWLRYKVYNRIPPLVRPLLYFFYRAVLQGGFLDGTTALTYHFLHALWYPLLIDLYYLEMRPSASRPSEVPEIAMNARNETAVKSQVS